MSPSPPFHTRTSYRWITAALGAGFIGSGAYLLLAERPLSLPGGLAGVALLLAGVDMVRAAWRGTVAWLDRIGPLP